tara:strand:+ start:28354 stop:28824 length:471 start_codon:yes stop_codon:yes gene_type:complete
MESINVKVFELHDQGLKAGKIAQKLKIKKAIVLDILGEAGKSAGLGDIIANVTEVTGIKAVVEALTDDCGCAARAETLNKLFPNKKINDLSNEDYDFLKVTFTPKKPSSVSRALQSNLVDVYNRVFNAKREVSSCSPCVSGMVNELEKIYNAATDN